MIRLNRTKNTIRNIGFGFLHRIIALIFPFLTRTVLIYRFGEVYSGLSSVFSSVFQILNLMELGFSSAIVYSLYRPVAEQDDKLIGAYLKAFRTIYRCIGFFILITGILLIPALKYIIKDSSIPSDLNSFICYSTPV